MTNTYRHTHNIHFTDQVYWQKGTPRKRLEWKDHRVSLLLATGLEEIILFFCCLESQRLTECTKVATYGRPEVRVSCPPKLGWTNCRSSVWKAPSGVRIAQSPCGDVIWGDFNLASLLLSLLHVGSIGSYDLIWYDLDCLMLGFLIHLLWSLAWWLKAEVSMPGGCLTLVWR